MWKRVRALGLSTRGIFRALFWVWKNGRILRGKVEVGSESNPAKVLDWKFLTVEDFSFGHFGRGVKRDTNVLARCALKLGKILPNNFFALGGPFLSVVQGIAKIFI